MATLDHTVAHKSKAGKLYTLASMGPGVRSHFAKLLKARAWRELDQQKEGMDVDRYTRLESSIMRDMGAGAYEWGDSIHVAMSARQEAILEALARMRSTDPDATEKDIETLVNEIGWERLRAIMAQADGPKLPNEQAPRTDGAKQESMTNGSSEKSSEDTQGKTQPE